MEKTVFDRLIESAITYAAEEGFTTEQLKSFRSYLKDKGEARGWYSLPIGQILDNIEYEFRIAKKRIEKLQLTNPFGLQNVVYAPGKVIQRQGTLQANFTLTEFRDRVRESCESKPISPLQEFFVDEIANLPDDCFSELEKHRRQFNRMFDNPAQKENT